MHGMAHFSSVHPSCVDERIDTLDAEFNGMHGGTHTATE